MIPPDRLDVFETGLSALSHFARTSGARGRLIALYLGLRRMQPARLGSASTTPAGEIEQFLDAMFTKIHREEPLVVLTAPFGGSTSPTAPYSARTGVVAPGNKYATNTWRNNFAIQKGVGCPAEATVIADLLRNPLVRLGCPHMAVSPEFDHVCSLASTAYRGEEHSIWLRMMRDGYQVVDLDLPTVWQHYLHPNDQKIPVFALISVLYCLAVADFYPDRPTVGIPDFAADFQFAVERVDELFDCNPDSELNAAVLAVAQVEPLEVTTERIDGRARTRVRRGPVVRPPEGDGTPLPVEADPTELNTGLGAERAVASQLVDLEWTVAYRGNQALVGYDLEAKKEGQILCVEVKSSVGFCTPELTESEWTAARDLRDEYVLAVVDFYGSENQAIWYVRDPASMATAVEIPVTRYRLPRAELTTVSTEADFL